MLKQICKLLVVGLSLVAANAFSQTTESALTCDDFRPTAEGLERYPNLEGACEAVIERDGELFGAFSAIVRRAGSETVTLYMPATDKTFRVTPDPETRIVIGGTSLRPSRLSRGQEIRVYLPVSEFAEPNVDEISLVTEANVVISHPIVPVAALPTTASLLPAIGLTSLGFLGAGWLIRRRRLRV